MGKWVIVLLSFACGCRALEKKPEICSQGLWSVHGTLRIGVSSSERRTLLHGGAYTLSCAGLLSHRHCGYCSQWKSGVVSWTCKSLRLKLPQQWQWTLAKCSISKWSRNTMACKIKHKEIYAPSIHPCLIRMQWNSKALRVGLYDWLWYKPNKLQQRDWELFCFLKLNNSSVEM